MDIATSGKKINKKTIASTIGALGVVYSDIGTSPLYAIKEIFWTHLNEIL